MKSDYRARRAAAAAFFAGTFAQIFYEADSWSVFGTPADINLHRRHAWLFADTGNCGLYSAGCHG